MTPRCTHLPQGHAAQAAIQHRDALPRLVTARLVLRAPQMGDLGLWSALYAGPDAELIGGPLAPREAWNAFCVYVAGWALHGHGLWAVDRRDTGALIGFVMIGLDWHDPEPELGWALAPEARGQGFAAEAAEAARDHAQALLGAGGYVSTIAPNNPRSARLAAGLGAARDGTAEAALSLDLQIWRHAPHRTGEAA